MKKPTRSQVVISYSHEDRVWLQRMQKHLKPYVRNATIAVWNDTQIKAGTKWQDEIFVYPTPPPMQTSPAMKTVGRLTGDCCPR